MNKDLIFTLLRNRYTGSGRHLAEVFDDPVFKKLSLDDQNTFLQRYREDFRAPVYKTLGKPSVQVMGGTTAAAILGGYHGYNQYMENLLSNPGVREQLIQRVAKKGGIPFQELNGMYSRIAPTTHELAWVPRIMKDRIPAFIKSPHFRTTIAIVGGATLALLAVSHLLRASQLKARSDGILNSSTPEGSIIEGHNGEPILQASNPLLGTAKGLLRPFSPLPIS